MCFQRDGRSARASEKASLLGQGCGTGPDGLVTKFYTYPYPTPGIMQSTEDCATTRFHCFRDGTSSDMMVRP